MIDSPTDSPTCPTFPIPSHPSEPSLLSSGPIFPPHSMGRPWETQRNQAKFLLSTGHVEENMGWASQHSER